MSEAHCHPERYSGEPSGYRKDLGTKGTHTLVPRSFASTLRMTCAFFFLLLSSATFADNKIRIEIPVFAGGEGMDFFTQCARDYEKVNPNVIVDLYGDSRIDDKVRIRVLEGTWFEATNSFGLNWWGLIKRGDIEPLDAALDGPSWEGDRTWRDSFVPGGLDPFKYQG